MNERALIYLLAVKYIPNSPHTHSRTRTHIARWWPTLTLLAGLLLAKKTILLGRQRTLAQLVSLNLITMFPPVVFDLLFRGLDVDAVGEIKDDRLDELEVVVILAQRGKLLLTPVEVPHHTPTNVHLLLHLATLTRTSE